VPNALLLCASLIGTHGTAQYKNITQVGEERNNDTTQYDQRTKDAVNHSYMRGTFEEATNLRSQLLVPFLTETCAAKHEW
jgi:hypothetical protein